MTSGRYDFVTTVLKWEDGLEIDQNCVTSFMDYTFFLSQSFIRWFKLPFETELDESIDKNAQKMENKTNCRSKEGVQQKKAFDVIFLNHKKTFKTFIQLIHIFYLYVDNHCSVNVV